MLIDVAALKGVDMLRPSTRSCSPSTAHILENLKLEELAAKRVHEFAFVMQPLKLKGGTGSTVAPIAIR